MQDGSAKGEYMSDKYDDEIIEEEMDDEDDQQSRRSSVVSATDQRRQTGKMIDLPNNIHICPDCMQRSFDSMNQQMNNGNFNYSDLFNMPNISMIDLTNFQNPVDQPEESQKRKKQKSQRTGIGSEEDPGTSQDQGYPG